MTASKTFFLVAALLLCAVVAATKQRHPVDPALETASTWILMEVDDNGNTEVIAAKPSHQPESPCRPHPAAGDDRVVVSYNACKLVGMVGANAAAAALKIIEQLGEAMAADGERYSGCTIGAALGECAVGNMGTATSKRFCTVGPVYQQAAALERLCKQHRVSTLVSMGTALEHQMFLRHVDVVPLPTTKGTVVPTLISALVAPKDQEGGEWMYAIEREKGCDASAAVNAVYEAYAKKDVAKAQALAAAVPDCAKRVLRMAETDVGSYCARQGRFFATLLDYNASGSDDDA